MSKLEEEFSKIRSQFPMLRQTVNGRPFIYLDSAATAQKPEIVIDTIASFYREHYGTVHRAIYTTAAYATEIYQLTRSKIAKFLNASHENEIIYTRGTTSAINLVAHSFGKAFMKPQDVVLITEMEHHSNIVPWQIMAEERGATLKVVPFLESGELDMQALKKELATGRVKILAVTHISNVLGTLNPVKEICALAHASGAKVLIDGAQSAPHIPVDVQDIGADFFVFSGHKLVGPTGVGALYGKKELLDQMPPLEGGGDMIETVTFEKTTYNTVPLKFEAGTPMIAEVIGLHAALDFMLNIGMEKIERWEQELFDYLLPRMQEIPGLQVVGLAKARGALVTFMVDGVHPLDIATMLDLKGVAVRSGHLCAQPVMRHFHVTAMARASLAFYNNKQDIDSFIDALRDVVAKLK
ncbi:MAG: cysteine desulfurase [Chlamydiia bacterium]|nr:cysteine desulfurase [Chlamydiia bacterium]